MNPSSSVAGPPSSLQPPTVKDLERSRLLTSRIRVLPDFLILGTQKGGTTSLYAYLSEHPAIAPARAKEIHFFDYNFARGEAWYRAHFPTYWERLRGRFQLTGEATPYYLFYPHAAWRAAQFVPHAKLIVLLRNPVDRAYSHYQHQVRLGLETLSFEDAIEQEAARLIGEFEELLSDDEYYSFNYQNYSYCARGMYADQLTRWFRYFPREQFLVLRSEDFYANPAGQFARVLEFLQAPRWRPDFFRVENDGGYAPMSTEMRAQLVNFFAPHNERLYELLNVDFEWK